MRITPIKRPTKSGPVVGKVPRLAGTTLFLTSAPPKASKRDNVGKAANQHGKAQCPVVERVIAVEPGEGRSIVTIRGGEAVQDIR